MATHQNPDGDAIGSMLAVSRLLVNRGCDVVMWHPDDPAVPEDLAFLMAEDEVVVRDLPDDHHERTLIALDCATAERLGGDRPPASLAGRIINIDHHRDNDRYGDLNLIDGSVSSTAELVLALMDEADFPLTRPIAEALHVGVITDTGRLSYSNTTPATLRADARLVEAGVDVSDIARRLYENTELTRLTLTGRALSHATPLLGGRLIVAALDATDFDAAGTDDCDGIVEMLRSARGAKVAALIRVEDGGLRVSLRASDTSCDVAKIAQAGGGGGHPAAAGIRSTMPVADFIGWLTEQVAAQIDG